jgi:hypothetical protein
MVRMLSEVRVASLLVRCWSSKNFSTLWRICKRWTKPIRAGVARILANRTSFIRTCASASENLLFDQLMHKVEKCMDTDSHVIIF